MIEIAAGINGRTWWRVDVEPDVYQRLVVLQREGVEGLPNWIDQLDSPKGRRRLLTDDPRWFGFDPT